MKSIHPCIVVLFALSVGCDSSSSGGGSAAAPSASAAVSAAAASASTATAPKAHAEFGHHGGIAAGIFRATNDLTLTDAQKASVDKIETSLKADDDGIRTAMKSFRGDLVAGVRAGKLDTAKLTGDDGIVDKAIADHQSKEAAALDSLHSLLTPVQRPALVANIRAKQADHESHMTEWMQGKGGDGGTVDWTKKLDLGMMPGKTAHDPMDHMVAYYTQLLPILHPDQRDKLATSMDKPFGADRRGPGGGGAAGGGGGGAGDDISFPFSEPEETP